MKNLCSGDTNTIWTVTDGRKGFCIELNCAGEGECQNRERDKGENRSGKGGREGDRGNRDVMIPAKDPDPEFDFQLLCNSGSGFGCNKRRNPSNCGGVMILGLDPDPDPKSFFQPFCESGSRFGSR